MTELHTGLDGRLYELRATPRGTALLLLDSECSPEAIENRRREGITPTQEPPGRNRRPFIIEP